MSIYVAQSGDTLNRISRQTGISVQRLISDNGLLRPERLAVGQALVILEPQTTYRARRGDTLSSIATRFDTTVKALLRCNPWLSVFPLTPGRELTVSFFDKPSRTARLNGYAYPFISIPLLRRTLPFLSTLTVFGYGFTPEGELIAPDDEPLLTQAKVFGVAPILLLSSITENGNFSSERASLLFNSVQLQVKVFDALVETMGEKGYRGLDIDFEYVPASDAEAFIAFIENACAVMHENGYFVNVDLAPKASADQLGLLYEAHDYARIGALADTVLLMTYEWGYKYGPPMAVAPINQVRRIVAYAVSEIPREKIMLGIPNYGYDWELPFEKGITQAETIGNEYAVAVASDNRAVINFDLPSAAPWFNYGNSGGERVVWFEDARSLEAKFGVVNGNALLGAGYWNLMRPFAQNISLLNVTYVPAAVGINPAEKEETSDIF